MQQISVVIICKNEADAIAETLQSFSGLTDDIIVYDNGSTDGTQQAVKGSPVHFHTGQWEGFGQTKNKANLLAKYDWILSLDADEAIDEELKNNLLRLDLNNDKTVYKLKFKNFLGDKWLRFGEWGNDKHIRLFNRKRVKWNDAVVHEELVFPQEFAVVQLSGFVLHKTVDNVVEYKKKMKNYAMMNADKYFKEGRKFSLLRFWLSPSISFFKNYFLKLGFLDGRKGLISAGMTMKYTFLKYKRLRELWNIEQGTRNYEQRSNEDL